MNDALNRLEHALTVLEALLAIEDIIDIILGSIPPLFGLPPLPGKGWDDEEPTSAYVSHAEANMTLSQMKGWGADVKAALDPQ